ncbi:MAG TPA: sporulation peptidase YabG [Tenericutes bacterium]|nr:sporulation peptidase YabG [Mycoplasmatota bacterium]
MNFKVGDYVTRKSHNNDVVFIITDIVDNICYLKGINFRLCADSEIEDLVIYNMNIDKEEEEFIERIKPDNISDVSRSDYFYLPGKILHIDSDDEYLKRCLKYYESANIWAFGIKEKESNFASKIHEWLKEYNPSIIVITGHDAFYRKKGSEHNIKSYKNSINFVNAVKEARRFEKSHEKLIIIAGACQSNYEELIKAGANFASSPKRVNIHALDPAIIATKMSLSDASKEINIKSILENTKYGKEGMGGVITKGTMYVGYPR